MSRVETIGNRATLYLGDCREVLPALSPVDAVITDPPYGVDKADWDTKFPSEDTWGLLKTVSVDGANIIIIPGEADLPSKSALLSSVFTYQWIIVWYKPNAMQFGKTGFSKHSLIWWFSKGRPIYRPSMIDLIEAPMGMPEDKHNHPSPKPIKVMSILVTQFCEAGGVILDPFMGSGSTGVAAVRHGRQFIGVEKNPNYFDLACRRIEEAHKQPDMFIEPRKEPEQTTMALISSEKA